MNRKRTWLKDLNLLPVLLGLGLLGACGGGGGGGSTSNNGGGGTTNVAPAITGQPGNATVTLGQMASFSAAATGTPTPGFQWERSGDGTIWSGINGATNASLSFTPAKADHTAQFRAKAANVAGTAISNAAILGVQWAPTFTMQPANQSVSSPAPATFSVATDANPAASYQWQSSPNGTQWADQAGAISATFGTGATSGAINNLQFRCIATNPLGSATSSAATLLVNVPTFTLTVNLSAGATGTPAATSTFAVGTAVNYSYTVQSGFTNLQVMLDGSPATAAGTLSMNGAHTLAVSATPIQRSVTFAAGPGGSLSGKANQSVVNGGSTTPVTAVPNGGFSFMNWTGAGFTTSANNPLTLTNVTQDFAITANFSAVPVVFTLTVGLGNGVTGTPSASSNFVQGSSVNYSYSTLAGFTNLSVLLDGSAAPASGIITMNAAHSLVATAQAVVPANTIEVGQGGAIFSPTSLTVRVGTAVTFHWANGGHSVVIGTPCTDGGVLNTGVQSAGFQVVFTPMAAGDVPFFCAPHCGFGMTGVIHVTP